MSVVSATATIASAAAGSGGDIGVQLSAPTGKKILMATVMQTSGLNLFSVWLQNIGGNNAVSVKYWNGRGDTVTNVPITVVGIAG